MSMRERLDEILRRISAAAPFSDWEHAQITVEEVMRAVEDEFSGVRENPDAHLARTTDGRMYPPHTSQAVPSKSPQIRAFRQKGHRTLFGENGALRIERIDGVVEIDLAGHDGRKIADLRTETKNDAD